MQLLRPFVDSKGKDLCFDCLHDFAGELPHRQRDFVGVPGMDGRLICPI
jgi:hypothetical protein